MQIFSVVAEQVLNFHRKLGPQSQSLNASSINFKRLKHFDSLILFELQNFSSIFKKN